MCDDINECQIKDMTYENKSFYEITKEYIDKVLGTNLSEDSKNALTKTKEILNQDQANNENNKMKNESVVDKLAKNLGVKNKRSFVSSFKMIATILLVLFILYLLYLIIFKSLP